MILRNLLIRKLKSSLKGHIDVDEEVWNSELRIKKFSIKVNEIRSYFDNVNLDKFTKLILFMMKIFNNEEMKRKNLEIRQNLLQELKLYGPDAVRIHIQKILENKIYKIYGDFKENSIFHYEVKRFNLTLLSNMTPFVEVQLHRFIGFHRANEQSFQEMELSIQYFIIQNLITEKDDEFTLMGCLGESKLKR